VWHREVVTRVALRVLGDEGDDATVLCRSSMATLLGSPARNRRAWSALGAKLILRQLHRLYTWGPAALSPGHADDPSLPFDTQPSKPLPSNLGFVASLSRHWWGRLSRRVAARAIQHRWILLYAFGPEPSRGLQQFRSLWPPSGRFWADPFVLLEDGQHYVFFEELEYRRGKGHICVIRLDPDGSVSAAYKVLERPYHLSYPFLLRWQGELYMIPETGDQGTLEAYRCIRFPDRWEFHGYLMRDQPVYDATLLEWGGRWWLFAILTGDPCDADLHVFSAESPLSASWTPHPGNPVVSDVTRSRPAGNLFVEDGRLYRPAQDSSRYYGYAVRVQEILTLTEQEYRERDATSLVPWKPAIAGVHHFTFAGGLTLIDAQIRQWRVPWQA
jgi:hypothetical protein